jgi:cell division protein DivIC
MISILATMKKYRLPQRIIKSPYMLLTLGFAIWMLFFDSADLMTQYKLTRQIRKLREEQIYYLKQIEIVTKERQELMSSEELLEKFAREKYLMKKPTEDIYILEE